MRSALTRMRTVFLVPKKMITNHRIKKSRACNIEDETEPCGANEDNYYIMPKEYEHHIIVMKT